MAAKSGSTALSEKDLLFLLNCHLQRHINLSKDFRCKRLSRFPLRIIPDLYRLPTHFRFNPRLKSGAIVCARSHVNVGMKHFPRWSPIAAPRLMSPLSINPRLKSGATGGSRARSQRWQTSQQLLVLLATCDLQLVPCTLKP